MSVVATGKLRHLLDLQKQSVTRNDMGEAVQAWTTVQRVWGQVRATMGTETLVSDQLIHEAPITIVIRWSANIKPDSKFRFYHGAEDVTYDIVSVVDEDGLRRFWTCRCKESSRRGSA